MPRRSGRGPDYDWLGLDGNQVTFSAPGKTTLSGSFAFLTKQTIMRVRSGGFMCMLDATQQVGDFIEIAVGLCVASTDAVAAGAGSLPDAFADIGYPWLWWTAFHLRSELAAGVNDLGSSVYRSGPIDSKAMRRVSIGQSLIWVAEIISAAGAPVTLFDMPPTRVLSAA